MSPIVLTMGYVAVWLGFALVMAGSQWLLARAVLLPDCGERGWTHRDFASSAGIGISRASRLKSANSTGAIGSVNSQLPFSTIGH